MQFDGVLLVLKQVLPSLTPRSSLTLLPPWPRSWCERSLPHQIWFLSLRDMLSIWITHVCTQCFPFTMSHHQTPLCLYPKQCLAQGITNLYHNDHHYLPSLYRWWNKGKEKWNAAQGHTAKWQSWDLNSGHLTAEPVLLTPSQDWSVLLTSDSMYVCNFCLILFSVGIQLSKQKLSFTFFQMFYDSNEYVSSDFLLL